MEASGGAGDVAGVGAVDAEAAVPRAKQAEPALPVREFPKPVGRIGPARPSAAAQANGPVDLATKHAPGWVRPVPFGADARTRAWGVEGNAAVAGRVGVSGCEEKRAVGGPAQRAAPTVDPNRDWEAASREFRPVGSPIRRMIARGARRVFGGVTGAVGMVGSAAGRLSAGARVAESRAASVRVADSAVVVQALEVRAGDSAASVIDGSTGGSTVGVVAAVAEPASSEARPGAHRAVTVRTGGTDRRFVRVRLPAAAGRFMAKPPAARMLFLVLIGLVAVAGAGIVARNALIEASREPIARVMNPRIAEQRYRLTKARADLIQRVVAMYAASHGRPPERLEALVPQYLPGIPRPLNGATEWDYRVNADGSFTIAFRSWSASRPEMVAERIDHRGQWAMVGGE